ncbi:MAG TPA: response regulator [Propionibacteriaceae bacterium]|nr:response regulator [Propionibacteriaceae bacterium]
MITVLVVDDDFRVARIHSAFVDRVDGFGTVGSAGTGREALDQARRLQPDLILLDLYLPDIFGLDLLNQLRVAGVEGDAIVISAANESETVERALKLGVANYLLKPFSFDDLANRLNEYRAQRSRRPRPLVGNQAEVDRIFGRPGTGRLTALPKGLSPETAELILRSLSAEPRSAQECADAAGISRVSARRYLELYVQQGMAQVSLRYGSRGRPERRYTRVADGS